MRILEAGARRRRRVPSDSTRTGRHAPRQHTYRQHTYRQHTYRQHTYRQHRTAGNSEWGTMQLEVLVELKFLDSSFSSSPFSIRAFRASPLNEIRQIVPCRAVRGSSISVSSTLPPYQQRSTAVVVSQFSVSPATEPMGSVSRRYRPSEGQIWRLKGYNCHRLPSMSSSIMPFYSQCINCHISFHVLSSEGHRSQAHPRRFDCGFRWKIPTIALTHSMRHLIS